jgi:predicted ATPase
MKILQLDIEGFRSLKKVSWKPGDLNVIIGPNGTGKSNLLRFLELMSVAVQGNLGKYIQSLGGMEPIVWDGQANSISFKVKISRPEEKQNVKQTNVIYLVDLMRLGRSSSYRIQNELLADYSQVQIGKQVEPSKLLERHDSSVLLFDEKQQMVIALDDLLELDKSILEYSESETFISVAAVFVSNRLTTLFRKELAAWAIYHDVHEHKDAVIRQAAVDGLEG